MKKRFNSFRFYIILIAIAILLANFLVPGDTQQEQMDYSQFVKLVQNNKIQKVTMIGSEAIEGTYNNEEFYLDIPDEVVPDVMNLLEENDVNISTEPEPSMPWWLNILSYIFPVFIFIAIWLFLMRRMQGGGGRVSKFGKSKARLLEEEEKTVDFDDVANYEEVKEELSEVVEFLKAPHKFSEMGAEVPKGVLLVGPPGTGKTLMARAVAGEAGVPFYIVSGSDFVEMFVGVGASRVRDLFEQAKNNAPCIIFVDELDAVGRQRGAGLGGGHDEREQTLNQLLVEMDGFESNQGIIVMAATNRPDVLDKALLRPGRFDRQVVVDAPDYHGRLGILKIHTKDKPLADDVDLDALARRTPSFTGADLENMANEAAILAVRRGQKIITMQDFDDAVDRVIVGLERDGKKVNEEDRKVVAYHETGHAVITELLDGVERVHKISIIPRGRAGGYNIPIPKEERMMKSKKHLLDTITSLLGGRAAEEIFLNEISTGASNDLEKVTSIARSMVTKYGMSEKLGHLTLGAQNDEHVFLGRQLSNQRNYSEEVAATVDKEIKRIVDNCYNRALDLLEDNSDIVERIVDNLYEHEKLDSAQIEKIMNREPLNSSEELDN